MSWQRLFVRRIQGLVDEIYKKRVMDVEQKLEDIITPLLGDRASEFKDLIGKKDLEGLNQFLAELGITITVESRKFCTGGVYGQGYKLIDEIYTVCKGNSIVGSFQEAW